MAEILVTLPDGTERSFESGASAKDVAGSIGKGLQKAGIAAKYNGELVDYTRPLTEDGAIEIITNSMDEGLEVIRHSAAHIMAQAIKRLHPNLMKSVLYSVFILVYLVTLSGRLTLLDSSTLESGQ